MKVSKRLLSLVIALAAILPAMAQFSIGPRVGVALNTLELNEHGFGSDNRAGFTGGLQAELMIPMVNFGFDASVMYVRRTSDIKGENGLSVDRDYIEIPINLKYKFGLPMVGSLVSPYIFTGPSFAFKVSGEDFSNFIHEKKCNMSWNFGFGLQLIKHLQVGASYGIGLSKVADFAVENVNIEAKHNGWTITAAWLF
ncbi:MAG: porin family protein [Muribaculaceae bacterium]